MCQIPAFKNTEQVSMWRFTIARMKTVRRIAKLQKWYDRRSTVPDLNENFVYFAPNYQPERSTNPDAGYFHDYNIVLSMLEKAVPSGWKIYYKEHPRTFHFPVSDSNSKETFAYKQLMVSCPRLQFVDRSFDPFKLIDNAKCVAVVTGTTGWEALCRNKPVLVFGTAWYKGTNFCYPVSSGRQCADAIHEITLSDDKDNNNIEHYLMAVESCTVDLTSYFDDNSLLRNFGRSIFASGKNAAGETREEFSEKMASELYAGYQRFKSISKTRNKINELL